MSAIRLLTKLPLVFACAVVVSCSTSKTTYYSDTEGRFSENIIDAITPDATHVSWLYKQFGSPLWVDTAPNDVAIYTWPFTREEYKSRHVLLLLRSRKVVEDTEYLHAVAQQDTVVKHWQDSHAQVDVKRVTYALGLDKPLAVSTQAAAQGSTGLRQEPMVPVREALDSEIVVEQIDDAVMIDDAALVDSGAVEQIEQQPASDNGNTLPSSGIKQEHDSNSNIETMAGVSQKSSAFNKDQTRANTKRSKTDSSSLPEAETMSSAASASTSNDMAQNAQNKTAVQKPLSKPNLYGF